MVRSLRSMFALVLLLASATAFAGQTWVQARAVTHSCGYYSTQNVEVTLDYQNQGLPWGTSVYLVYGWGGYTSTGSSNVPFTWDQSKSIPVSASAPYTWRATVTSNIAVRSSPKFYDSINFVWRVVLPDGSEFYEKGNTSTFGYYAASFANVPRPCVSTSGFIGTPQALNVVSVEKW